MSISAPLQQHSGFRTANVSAHIDHYCIDNTNCNVTATVCFIKEQSATGSYLSGLVPQLAPYIQGQSQIYHQHPIYYYTAQPAMPS